jgi:hypothetical protein
MEAGSFPEMMLASYQTTLFHIPNICSTAKRSYSWQRHEEYSGTGGKTFLVLKLKFMSRLFNPQQIIPGTNYEAVSASEPL